MNDMIRLSPNCILCTRSQLRANWCTYHTRRSRVLIGGTNQLSGCMNDFRSFTKPLCKFKKITLKQDFVIVYVIMYVLCLRHCAMGAFTNDVIIQGGRGFGKDDGGGECWAKLTSLFYMISGRNFKQFILKSWFYYKKMSFIVRKLSRLSDCTYNNYMFDVCAPYQKRTLPKVPNKCCALHAARIVTIVCFVSSDLLVL